MPQHARGRTALAADRTAHACAGDAPAGERAGGARQPRYRLVGPGPEPASPRSWPESLAPLFGAAGWPGAGTGWHPWRVLGGPGSGKTSLVVDLATEWISAGADPESVLVLTSSRRASAAVRDAITARLFAGAAPGYATRGPIVRTVHSYAFAVLRLQASLVGNPPPRLLTSSEQDVVVRELLRGHLDDYAEQGVCTWPTRLIPALGLAGFARELRELLQRCAERDVAPEDLVRLGRTHQRADWVAAGQFGLEYEQAMMLRWSVGVESPEASSPALSAAELVGAAAVAFAADPELLARERARVRFILVDDAQHLDPAAASLIESLGSGGQVVVLAGDPDQLVYDFRGADTRLLTDGAAGDSSRTLTLERNFRFSRAVAPVIASLQAGLGRRGPVNRTGPDATPGSVAVHTFSSPAKQAGFIADRFRRAHADTGMPWSRMAVIVRSVPSELASLRRAFGIAGVPVATAATQLPLAVQRGAVFLLLALRVAIGDFTSDDAIALVTGPLGSADPVALRQLRRGLRRAELAAGGERESTALIEAILRDPEPFGPGGTISAIASPDRSGQAGSGQAGARPSGPRAGADEGPTEAGLTPLRRVCRVVTSARAAIEANAGVEETLWAAWRTSGLESAWANASLRGGSVGHQADRDLDAVVSLFDSAAAYVDRLPGASVGGFIEYVEGQVIPVGSAAQALVPDAVTVLSAHASAGREFDIVAVASVQEGTWPNLRARGSLLGTDTLLELLAGVRTSVSDRLSRTAPILASERRLFYLACSRARESLLVTAVSSAGGEDQVPSRFVDELDMLVQRRDFAELIAPGTASYGDATTGRHARPLSQSALVASLRAVACDRQVAESDPARYELAVRQLARLAAAGVRFADPDTWYGVAPVSTDAPIVRPDAPITVSPSAVELVQACPLRWALERKARGDTGDSLPMVRGSIVHTSVQALAGSLTPEQVDLNMANAWTRLDLGSDWYSRQQFTRTQQMLATFLEWVRATRHELTMVDAEVQVTARLSQPGDEPDVLITGRIDRLERNPDGQLVIVDVKTSAAAITKEEAHNHAQLATYQVAVAHGGIEQEPGAEPGGGILVYVAKPDRKGSATQREQPRLHGPELDERTAQVRQAALDTRGPAYLAIANPGCDRCPVTGSCPVQDQGRQVTE